MLVFNRLYNDYFRRSRLFEYRRLLEAVISEGFEFCTIRDIYSDCSGDNEKKFFVNRHDIDTDPNTARLIFEIEKSLGVRSSYYFRMSTIDIDLMREIESFGGEASYHYEEIATYAKQNRIVAPEKILRNMYEIRQIFAKNLQMLEQKLGYKFTSVASHGDFANRRLRITNHKILEDASLRQQLGILWEAYDHELLRKFDIYISDQPAPQFYKPISPFDILNTAQSICLLTHPRQWKVSWWANSVDNVNRIYEEIRWRLAE